MRTRFLTLVLATLLPMGLAAQPATPARPPSLNLLPPHNCPVIPEDLRDGVYISECGGQLWRVDPGTGDATFVGRMAASSLDIAIGEDGVLYNLDGKVIYCVDATNADVRSIGDVGFTVGTPCLTGAPPDARGDRLLALRTLLIRVDLPSGVSSLIGPLDRCGVCMGDLAWRPSDGALFGSTGCGLTRIDPDSGRVLEEIGQFTSGTGPIFGMGFDGNEILYASGGEFLMDVDPTTAKTIAEVPIRGSQGHGLPDFVNTCGMAVIPGTHFTCDAGGPYLSSCRTAILDEVAVMGAPDLAVFYRWSAEPPEVDIVPDAGGVPPGPAERPIQPHACLLDRAIPPCGIQGDLTLTVTAPWLRARCGTTVTFDDDVPPDIEDLPSPLTVECTERGGTPASDPAIQAWLAQASATDLCTGATLEHDAPGFFPRCCPPGRATTVTWTATDGCYNESEASSALTVVDTTPPALTVPPPLTVECSAPGGTPADDPAIQAWLEQASADDICGSASVTDDAPAFFPGGCPPGIPTTVTWTATDECGNSTRESSTLTVVDTQPPVITRQPALGEDGCGLLWPPQHGYVDFTGNDAGIEAYDVCHAVEAGLFSSCHSSQPENVNGLGDGNSTRDCVFEGGSLHLRAERDGACAPVGRRYTMAMEVGDSCGHSTPTDPFDACVRHDRRRPRGPCFSPEPGSNQNDERSGTNGAYGADCGAGCHPPCEAQASR